MATETAHFAAMMSGDFRTPLAGREAEVAGREAEASEHLAVLVARARDGDATAFERIMLETERRVVAVAWRMLGNREDARDAAQEVFLRVYKYLDRYQPEQDFNGWLYRITINVCRDAIRKRGSRLDGAQFAPRHGADDERAAPLEAASSGMDAEENAIRAQQRVLLLTALETLPEKERAAIILRDLEGLTTEEVARVLRSRPVTVRSQISSARAKLKIHCARLLRKAERRV